MREHQNHKERTDTFRAARNAPAKKADDRIAQLTTLVDLLYGEVQLLNHEVAQLKKTR